MLGPLASLVSLELNSLWRPDCPRVVWSLRLITLIGSLDRLVEWFPLTDISL